MVQDLNTVHMNYDGFMKLTDPNNGKQLVKFLIEIGVIASSNTCLNCGGQMRKIKEGVHWVSDVTKVRKASEQVQCLITVSYQL